MAFAKRLVSGPAYATIPAPASCPNSRRIDLPHHGSVHTTDEATETAEEHGIENIWVPKGATGKYRPLVRRAFGALKSKGQAKWKFIFSQECGKQCTKEITAELLLQSRAELSDSAVEVGWDFRASSRG
jgi:hypothetical protein